MKGIFNIKKCVLLAVTFFVYSSASIFSKMASQNEVLSINFLFFYGCVVVVLGIYAILWQKVLSIMPLNKAFLCKSITILMILAVSTLIFNEAISINNLIGAGFIIVGLGFLAWKE